MDLSRTPIRIVGCGPGSAEFVSPAARSAVAGADVLVGSARLLALFVNTDDARPRIAVDARIDPLLDELAQHVDAGRSVALLVSGDPGAFSLAARVVARFGRTRCAVVPAVSSVQVAFARLALDWTDARIISAHGRSPDVFADELRASEKIAILAGTADAIAWCRDRAAAMVDTHTAVLMENLTLPNERIGPLGPAGPAASLSIVLLVRKELLA